MIDDLTIKPIPDNTALIAIQCPRTLSEFEHDKIRKGCDMLQEKMGHKIPIVILDSGLTVASIMGDADAATCKARLAAIEAHLADLQNNWDQREVFERELLERSKGITPPES